MAVGALKDRIVRTPNIHDRRAATLGFERLADAGGEAAQALAALASRDDVRRLLEAVFSGSAFLTDIVVRMPDAALRSLNAAPEEALTALCARVSGEVAQAQEDAAVRGLLRRARAEAALLIGLCDISGVWSVWDVTRALTRFADVCVDAALHFLARAAVERGDLDTAGGDPCRGLIVIGMGKYGAHELNYSSDIDLIALYDRSRLALGQGREAALVAIRIVKALVRLLQDRTEDGYVFRVDLRLRPDGNASPVALSVEAAELYYEGAGQNWERAAMIKARAVAGDIAAGEAFLTRLVPFVWRKHLDYAAIADIHSIKRQIHAVKGHGDIAVAGHNLKLGRGGIREIEFFAQTQQLIMGGRDIALRTRRTDEALARLADIGLIDAGVRDDMLDSYVALRTAEHRLQMIDDQQTHTLPEDGFALEAVARFSGFETTEHFAAHIRGHLERVHGHYADLFETEESLASETGSLVFTGVDDDPETLETLSALGFSAPGVVSSALRGWHHGRIRATRTARSRELLTRLTPSLLKAFGGTDDADRAFREFSRFLEALPTGVQIFSLLANNAWLLEELADLFALAPHMASVLAEAPGTLDGLIDTDFRASRPDLDDLKKDLDLAFARFAHLEAKLDAARIFARENRLRVAVQLLRGEIEPREAGEGFTQVAEAAVAGLMQLAWEELAARHGRVPGAEWAVIGMGKLGGRELTATSDLDLIFLYDHPGDDAQSDGDHPLAASQYFARVGQKLISLLTVPTSEGVLYEVDMRLRPSGRAGPIAVSLERFVTYHEAQAWTWEHMALTRARVIAGSLDFKSKIDSTIRRLLCREREAAAIRADIADMRRRLIEARGTDDPWLLKHVRGGLVDLEFIAQTLQLLTAHAHPGVLSTNTLEAFGRLAGAEALAADDAAVLADALNFIHGISHLVRVCLGAEASPDAAPTGLRRRMMKLAGSDDFEGLEARLRGAEAAVLKLYAKYVAGSGA